MKISAVSGGGGGGERKEQSVVEQLIFLRIDPEQVEPEDARECVENIWSLQYQTAGVVCSSAGASLEEKIGSGLLGSPKGLGYFTHAVHFRFPGRDQMDTFVQSPVVQKVRGITWCVAFWILRSQELTRAGNCRFRYCSGFCQGVHLELRGQGRAELRVEHPRGPLRHLQEGPGLGRGL
uniref:Stress-response A/B barrel domain-containing protein n=1 Tax=Chloropicon primus TaxID=1764295 RepID=A0A7S2WY05_9CHLO